MLGISDIDYQQKMIPRYKMLLHFIRNNRAGNIVC